MRVEEVKTSFIADTQKYIKDIQKAQKVLNTFLNTNDMTKKEKAENRLQVAIQKRAQAQAKALTEELKLKRQVNATNSKLASSQNNVNKSISKSSSSSKMFAGELAHTARNVMTLYYSVKSLGKVLTTGIDFNRTKEDARLAFTVMFRSADVATQKIKELQEYAVKSPLSFKETISASKQLSAYGFGSDELIPAMKMLGTVAKATGHSLDDIAYVYGTLRTQGKANSRDLMQFAMRGIPIYEELAEVMHVNQKEIKKLTIDGKVGFKEVEKAFKNMTKEGGKFGGLLDEQMKGFSGIGSQLEDIFQQSMGQMTEPLFEALKTQIRELIRIMDSGAMDDTFKAIGKGLADVVNILGSFIGRLIEAVPVLIGFFKAWLGYAVISMVIKSIIKFNVMLPLLTRNLIKAGIAVKGLASGTALSGMTSGLAMMGKAFTMFTKSILTALSGFAKSAWAIIAANPLLAVIMGIMAVGATIAITVNHRNQEKIQEERERIRKEQGTRGLFEFDVGRADMGTAVDVKKMQEVANLTKYKDFFEDTKWTEAGVQAVLYYTESGVKKIAEAYQISTSAAAAYLYSMDKIERKTLQMFAREESLTRATRDYNDALERNKDLQIQAWLAATTGKDKGTYKEDTYNTDASPIDKISNRLTGEKTNVYRTMGGTAAEDYISGLEESLKNKEGHLKYTWQELYSPDMMKDNVQSAIDEIDALLVEASQFTAMRGGKEIPWFNLTGWDEAMRKKREELIEMLGGGSGGKGVEIKIKLDPWFDREKMASATKMVFDDLELQRDKDLATAREKLNAQEISQAQYFRAVNAIHVKHLDDMVNAEKNAAHVVRDLWREGSDDWWGDVRLKTHKQIMNMSKNFANVFRKITPKFLFNITKESFKIDKDAAQSIWSYMKSVFEGIHNFFSSMRNPFSLGKSDSSLIKIDIDKEELGRNLGIIGSQLKAFGLAIMDVSKKAYKLAGQFMDFSVELAKTIGMSLLDGSQIGNVMSMVGEGRDAWVQAKKDDLVASGYDVTNFDEEQAATGYDVFDAAIGGIFTQSIMAFVNMISSVEEVSQVINAFDTLMEAAGTFLKPLLSVGFSGIASVLKEIGEVLGKVLLPILMPLMLSFQIVAGILKITVIPILQTVGAGFAWLYDNVMVPFGNAVIDLINGVIGLINKIPGINIEKLRKFKTTAEMLADSTESVNNTMEYMVKKLNDLIDKEIATLGDLYDVGAISGAEYARQVDDANMRRLSLEENLVDVNVAQMEEMQAIYDWLVNNGAFPDIEALLAAEKLGVELPEGFYNPEDISTYTTQTDTPSLDDVATQTGKQWENAKNLADSWGDKAGVIGTVAGAFVGGAADVAVAIDKGVRSVASKIGKGIANFFGFADGTSNIPYDMVANVHKGEGVIPATFMDAIRAGELTLSGNSGTSSGSITNYYITVEGSVTSENELADSLAEKIEQRRTRGYGRK